MSAAWFALAVAWAAPVPTLDVHVQGSVDVAPATSEGPWRGLGLGLRGGLRLRGPLWFEAGVEASFLPAGRARVSVQPLLRAFLTPWDRRWGAVSARLAVGLDLELGPGGEATPRPLLVPALALDLRAFDDLVVRVEAGYASHLVDAGAVHAQIGVVYTPRRAAPPPAPLADPPAPLADDGWMWLPQPRCDWTDRDAAMAYLEGRERGDGEVAAPSADELERAAQGTLVVVALPGDAGVVRLGEGFPLRVDPDGLSVAPAPEGDLVVEVWGGGRRHTLSPRVMSGRALWLRVPPPDPVELRFGLGSSDLSVEDAARVSRWARDTGSWGWRVVGSASPEGTPELNASLARARAETVVASLVAGGVPPGRVVIEVETPADPTGAPDALRRVILYPVPPEAP